MNPTTGQRKATRSNEVSPEERQRNAEMAQRILVEGCNCAELRLDGVALPRPDYANAKHDCAEVRRRNSFIEQATRIAIEYCGDSTDPSFATRFTSKFSRTMDELCRPERAASQEAADRAILHLSREEC